MDALETKGRRCVGSSPKMEKSMYLQILFKYIVMVILTCSRPFAAGLITVSAEVLQSGAVIVVSYSLFYRGVRGSDRLRSSAAA